MSRHSSSLNPVCGSSPVGPFAFATTDCRLRAAGTCCAFGELSPTTRRAFVVNMVHFSFELTRTAIDGQYQPIIDRLANAFLDARQRLSLQAQTPITARAI